MRNFNIQHSISWNFSFASLTEMALSLLRPSSFANFSRLSWTRRTRIRTTNATQRRNRVLDLQIFKELCMFGKLLLPSFQAMFKAPMHTDWVQCLNENEYIQKNNPTRVECFLGFEYSYPLALAPCLWDAYFDPILPPYKRPGWSNVGAQHFAIIPFLPPLETTWNNHVKEEMLQTSAHVFWMEKTMKRPTHFIEHFTLIERKIIACQIQVERI